jgi:Ca2+-binding RTX toxin-like protein
LIGPEIGRQVNRISFRGYAGDDTFRNDTPIGSFASGGAGNDTLYGGRGMDELHGGGGRDFLYGREMNDFLDGGVPGVAVYADNTGNDVLYGGSGDDTLHASDYGNCTLYGDGDNDTLFGWQGNDSLYGGSGNDALHGYTGNDRLVGGSGHDRYVFSAATSAAEVDTVVEYSGGGTDRLDFSALSAAVTVDLTNDTTLASHGTRRVATGAAGQAAFLEDVVGGAGGDRITGNGVRNYLYGGGGIDTLHGGGGSDYLYGGASRDYLYGDQDVDYLYGGSGNDYLYGGSENDYLWGESGADVLRGEEGRDWYNAGTEGDIAYVQAGEIVTGAERVSIAMDTAQVQTDSWSCGPNSGARFLRAYGHSADYTYLRSLVEQDSLLSQMELGTSTSELRSVLRQWRSATYSREGASFSEIVSLLEQGKPVIALINVGSEIQLSAAESAALVGALSGFNPFGFLAGAVDPLEFPKLHWIVLNGINKDTQTVEYTDTNGARGSWSYAEFQAKWNWNADATSSAILDLRGVRTRTFIA